MRYYFHPVAESEHLESVAYYESQRPGLGAVYLTEFEHYMSRVCESPNRYPVEKPPDVRRVRLQKFPFTILYRIAHAGIEVLAVAHHRRRPGYWLERTTR